MAINLMFAIVIGVVFAGFAADARAYRIQIERLQLGEAAIMAELSRLQRDGKEQAKYNNLNSDILERLARKVGK